MQQFLPFPVPPDDAPLTALFTLCIEQPYVHEGEINYSIPEVERVIAIGRRLGWIVPLIGVQGVWLSRIFPIGKEQ